MPTISSSALTRELSASSTKPTTSVTDDEGLDNITPRSSLDFQGNKVQRLLTTENADDANDEDMTIDDTNDNPEDIEGADEDDSQGENGTVNMKMAHARSKIEREIERQTTLPFSYRYEI